MVSNLRYYSFKEMDFKGKVPFLYVLMMIILFVAIAANPAISFICWFYSLCFIWINADFNCFAENEENNAKVSDENRSGTQ